MDEKVAGYGEIPSAVNADGHVPSLKNAAGFKYSVGCLAYMGDAVFELYVRKMLLSSGSRPVDSLNKQARQYVSAAAQAKMYHNIGPFLTDEEQAVMKRGRNLHSNSKAKNAGISDYRHATGLEALFGYLFLEEQHERLTEVFEICIQNG